MTPRANKLMLPRKNKPTNSVKKPLWPAGRMPESTSIGSIMAKRKLRKEKVRPNKLVSRMGTVLKLIMPSKPCVRRLANVFFEDPC